MVRRQLRPGGDRGNLGGLQLRCQHHARRGIAYATARAALAGAALGDHCGCPISPAISSSQGHGPLARIKLKYLHRPMAAARFVQRGELPPVEDKPAVPAGKSRRDADAKALKADAGRKRERHEEDAMPWSAGTAGNQRKPHRAPPTDKSNGAGTAGNKVSLNLPPPGVAPGNDTGETNGEEKVETPVPAPDAGKAPLPGKKKNLAAGDAENSEDEARAGNGNGALNTGKPGEPETDSRGFRSSRRRHAPTPCRSIKRNTEGRRRQGPSDSALTWSPLSARVASASQGISYYERDGYYAKDDPAHKESSVWVGKGAAELGLSGLVDGQVFKAVLEGKVPDGTDRQLGRKDRDGVIHHRPGRDVTLSAPKSVSLLALIGGDERVTAAHDRAVGRTLAWIEGKVVETRLKDPETGAMVRAGGQKMVAAAFRHDTSRNLDPQLHTHAVLANMVQGEDGKWRTMANEKLYASKMLIGALYRSELARELGGLGYRLEKTHADGRFEISGVPRKTIEAFSTRRAEIEAAMAQRGLGDPARTSVWPSARH